MKDNLRIWNELKEVPAAAKKTIQAGRLKGMTDIKPQWRLQMMTEAFGPIGIGWYYKPIKTWKEEYVEQVSVYVEVELFIRLNDSRDDVAIWSAPINGVGGSFLVAKESRGPYHSDECYKMATTDALSVAMKQLGVAADVYMGLSDSKYDKKEEAETKQPMPLATSIQKAKLKDYLAEFRNKAVPSAVVYIEDALENRKLTTIEADKIINHCKIKLETA
jgi:hypothetical protein